MFNIAIHIVEKYWNILTRLLYLVSREILQNLKYRKVESVEDYDLIVRAMLDSNVKFGHMGESLLKYGIRIDSGSHRNSVKSIIMSNKVAKTIRKNHEN